MALLTRVWDSANDIATAASLIARHIGYRDHEQAYMLGLFHNAGIPLLIQRYDNYFEILRKSYTGGDERIVDTENRYLNTNHAVVGYYVARSWKLAPILCKAISLHHSISEVFTAKGQADVELQDLVAILKLAEHVAGFHHVVAGYEEDYEWARHGDTVIGYLHLGDTELDDITSAIEDAGIGKHTYYT
jgi:HD-like signal output (HDOD) protein